MTLAIEAHGLVKRYGKTVALDGIDLELEQARVLGVLGPNGAGKTTAVRILATLLSPTPAPRRWAATTSRTRPRPSAASSASPGSTPVWTRT